MSFIARIACVAVALTVAGTATADGPHTLNFQGVLSDAGGQPIASSTRSVIFTIYDAPVGGSSYWAESRSITTDAAGRFTVVLGELAPLHESIFFDTSRYIGIQVESDPELVPRIRMTSSAYALRVRTIDGAHGGTLHAPPGEPASLVLADGAGNGTVEFEGGVFGLGGAAYLYENDGPLYLFAEPDVDGAGGFLGLLSDAGSLSSGIFMDGNTGGTGNPALNLWSTGSNVVSFDLSSSGDDVVVLPDDAISSPEILDEPGIASNSNAVVTLNTSAMVDIVTVSITIPAGGYVVVDGKCDAQAYNTTGYNGGYFQIDQTAGGSYATPYSTTVGYSAWPNLQGANFSVYTTRSYFFGSPGTYTFRLEGRAFNAGGGAVVEARNAIVRATYYPRSYGSVIAAVSSSEAGEFESAEPITGPAGPRVEPAAEQMFRVDLRELELRAARAREAARQAEAELLRARLAQQGTRRVSDSANK